MNLTYSIVLFTLSVPAVCAAEVNTPDQGPWWIGPLMTVLAAAIGASAIVWQMGRQHRNESLRQTENFKNQLKLEVYQEFSSKLSIASETVRDAAMYAFIAPVHFEIYASQVNGGFTPSPIAERALKLLELNAKATSDIVETLFLIEKYIIIHPDMDIFRTALSSASHDIRQSFNALFQFMLVHFPMDVVTDGGVKVDNVLVLTPDQRVSLKMNADAYHGSMSDLGSYLDDMRTELQILLLSSLFPNNVPRRRPADPSKKVLSLEPNAVKSLRNHFMKNTDWGKETVATQLDVHREFHG